VPRLGRKCPSGLAKQIDKEIQELAALGGGKLSAKRVRQDVRFKAMVDRVCCIVACCNQKARSSCRIANDL
jgi:hypothetical protein